FGRAKKAEVLHVEVDDLPLARKGALGDGLKGRNAVFFRHVEPRLHTGDSKGFQLVAYGFHAASVSAIDNLILPAGSGKKDAGGKPSFRSVLQIQGAGRRADEPAYDRQPEAGASRISASLCASHERPDQAFTLFSADARALVMHFQMHLLAACEGLDFYACRTVGRKPVFPGVLNEVGDGSLEIRRSDLHPEVRIDAGFQRAAPSLGHGAFARGKRGDDL